MIAWCSTLILLLELKSHDALFYFTRSSSSSASLQSMPVDPFKRERIGNVLPNNDCSPSEWVRPCIKHRPVIRAVYKTLTLYYGWCDNLHWHIWHAADTLILQNLCISYRLNHIHCVIFTHPPPPIWTLSNCIPVSLWIWMAALVVYNGML